MSHIIQNIGSPYLQDGLVHSFHEEGKEISVFGRPGTLPYLSSRLLYQIARLSR